MHTRELLLGPQAGNFLCLLAGRLRLDPARHKTSLELLRS